MDLSKIIRDAEAETAALAEARRKTQEEQKQEAANRLQVFTKDLHSSINEIIRPVLLEGCAQIAAQGYECRIKDITTSSPDFRVRTMTIGVELFMKGKTTQAPSRSIGEYTLSYEGDVQKFTISAVMNIFGAAQYLKGAHALAVSQVTKSLVEEHFTEFIQEVMKCEGQGVLLT